MFWRFSEFPELQHLEPDQRRIVLRKVAWWGYLRLMTFAFVVAVMLSVCVRVCLSVLADVAPGVAGWMSLASFVGFVAIIYQVQMQSVRRSMRTTLIEALGNDRMPFCLACGYDMRGSPSGRCPECGLGLVNREPTPEH